MGFKMKGFPMMAGSPLHQGRQRKLKKGKTLKTEHKDTYVYKGENFSEKITDLEDRIEFIKEDIFSDQDGKSTNKQSKDIAAMEKRIAKLREQKKSAK